LTNLLINRAAASPAADRL